MSKTKTHQKHAKLAKPSYGFFHRNEWAIIGAPCEQIQQLANPLISQLSSNYKVAYVDADYKGTNNLYQHRMNFNNHDLVIVNGNHFQAKNQIVILNPKKEASLSKELDKLTDIQILLSTTQQTQPYPFLKDHLGDQQPHTFSLEDISKIAGFIEDQMAKRKPAVYGLVLAGGKSQRMGIDKGAIEYYGIPQREYMAQLLTDFCDKVFVSIRPEQKDQLKSNFPLLSDSFKGLGPFGAMLSAFREHPDAAWLIIACDLPLMNKPSLQQLITSRNPSAVATAFNSPVNKFPEPLIAIWEPRSYPILLQFLAQGYSCPRKVLINSEVNLIDASSPDALMNVNNPEEREQVLATLNFRVS